MPSARARTGGSQRRAWMMRRPVRAAVCARARAGGSPTAGLDDAVRVLRLFCAPASARARTGGSQRRAWMLWRSLRYLRPWPVNVIGLGPLARGRATSPKRHQKDQSPRPRSCVHASPDLRVGKAVGRLSRPRMCPGLSCVQPPCEVESGNPTKDNTTAAARPSSSMAAGTPAKSRRTRPPAARTLAGGRDLLDEAPRGGGDASTPATSPTSPNPTPLPRLPRVLAAYKNREI